MTNNVSPYAPNRRSLVRELRAFSLVVIAFMAQGCSVQDDEMRPAVPIEPIGAITNAFKSHDIVALDEGDHGNEQGHVFRLALIRDPRFAAVVDDIVVEFGNARYQETMDRFIRGEDVPERELQRVWQD